MARLIQHRTAPTIVRDEPLGGETICSDTRALAE